MEPWTIRRVLDWSVGYLGGREVESPRLTAELLLAHCLGCTRLELYLDFDKPLEKCELGGYREILKRRVRREPTQYLLGSWEFWSLEFSVDQRVLIPRPETELLIEEAQRQAKRGALDPGGSFLELGTGSGAIACALASEFPEAKIDAVDVSRDALCVARKNVAKHQLGERVHLYHGDLYEPVKGQRYSLIVTNPPYIPSQEMHSLQEEVRCFEPWLALDGGEDGLGCARRILAGAPDHLLQRGLLLMEIGAEQGSSILQEAKQRLSMEHVKVLEDYAGRDRVLVCTLGNPTT